jgi:hypothetical protein
VPQCNGSSWHRFPPGTSRSRVHCLEHTATAFHADLGSQLGLCAGTFEDPIPISGVPYTTAPASLAEGHLDLSQPAASLCGYSPSTFAAQRKLVFAYHINTARAPGRNVTFSLCNSGNFVNNFWLLTCRHRLRSSGGADAATAGCTCALADDARPSCPSGGLYGFQGTTAVKAEYW